MRRKTSKERTVSVSRPSFALLLFVRALKFKGIKIHESREIVISDYQNYISRESNGRSMTRNMNKNYSLK